jgi:hypothetical protein
MLVVVRDVLHQHLGYECHKEAKCNRPDCGVGDRVVEHCQMQRAHLDVHQHLYAPLGWLDAL